METTLRFPAEGEGTRLGGGTCGIEAVLFVCFLICFCVLKGEILENFASSGEDSLWWER